MEGGPYGRVFHVDRDILKGKVKGLDCLNTCNNTILYIEYILNTFNSLMNDHSFIYLKRGGIELNIATRLEQIAQEKADKTAYHFLNTSSTYGELNGAVSKFASGLEQLGLKKGDHIALVLGNSPHFVIGLIWRASSWIKGYPDQSDLYSG